MQRWRRLRVLVVAGLLVGGTACGDDGGGAAGGGRLTVFAAASLTEALTDAQAALEAGPDGLDLTYSFAGSGVLVAQITQGAPADVIATADRASMQTLVDAGLVEAPTTFTRNRLQILVAPGNPRGIADLADLADPDLKVVLPDDVVPAGRYAAQALAKAGVAVSPVSKELDVKAAASKVTRGEADATIVYATDVTAAGDRAVGIDIPEEHNVVAEYRVAIVRATARHDAAEAFIQSIVSGAGRDALEARGFLAAVEP